ncbi:MAG: HAD-IIB family hydrolase [Lachnospiraceae bacterium]
MIRLIATDLDGTLLQNGAQSLTPEAISKIEHLITRRGILFVAASGRQYPNLCRLFGSAAKHMAFICENGAVVFYRGELLAAHPMECSVAVAISKDILNTEGCELLISGKQTSYLMPKTEHFYHRMKYVVKNDITLISSLKEVPEEYYKVSVYEASGIKEGHGPAFIKRWEQQAKCSISGREWLDFVHPEVNKGAALTNIMEQFSIAPSECAAFGDNYNDLEMLSAVKYGYVMKKAVPDIRNRFSYQCDDVLTAVDALLNETSR